MVTRLDACGSHHEKELATDTVAAQMLVYRVIVINDDRSRSSYVLQLGLPLTWATPSISPTESLCSCITLGRPRGTDSAA